MLLVALPSARSLRFFYYRPAQVLYEKEITL